MLFNKFLDHYDYPQINVPRDIFGNVNIGSNSQSTATNTSPSTLTACSQNQVTHASQTPANVDTQTPILPVQPPALASVPSPKPTIGTSPSLQPIPTPQVHDLPIPSMQVSSPPPIPLQTLPPPPPISKLSILAKQTLSLHTSLSSITNNFMQVNTSALASPLLENPITPPLISQLHGSPLTQLTPPNIATPSNHQHVPIPSPTTPDQTNRNSNLNQLNSSTISPINFIYRLSAFASLNNSIEPSQNTPKISKRHALAANLLIGSLNDSYNFRAQRRLVNYYES